MKMAPFIIIKLRKLGLFNDTIAFDRCLQSEFIVDIVDIETASDGTVWFATRGGGVSVYDEGNWRKISDREYEDLHVQTIKALDTLADNRVWAIFEDSQKTFGSVRNAAASAAMNAHIRFTAEMDNNGQAELPLAHNTVHSVYEYPGGVLWFELKGISSFDTHNESWSNFYPSKISCV
jgi:hypothetical protein